MGNTRFQIITLGDKEGVGEKKKEEKRIERFSRLSQSRYDRLSLLRLGGIVQLHTYTTRDETKATFSQYYAVILRDS